MSTTALDAIDLTNWRGRSCSGARGRGPDFPLQPAPNAPEEIRLDPETLLARNKSLVHATLTGYGTDGPEASRPGYDVTAFFGRSGLYDAMREGPDGFVPMARPAQGDHTTGLALFGAIMAGLRMAEKTGEGQVVETSLFETAVWTQATDYAITAVDKAPVRRRTRNQQITATANRYPCGDGKWIVINNPEQAAWPRFCKAIGQEAWLEKEEWIDQRSRFYAMADVVAAIDEVLATRAGTNGAIFDAAGLIWGPVLSLDEVAKDPQAQAIGLFPTIESEVVGSYHSVRIPMRMPRRRSVPRAGPRRRRSHRIGA